MISLKTKEARIPIKGTETEVVNTYLRVYLAKLKLTDKQLEVATALAIRYTEYINDGVKEPYASTLLFSTKMRKAICKELSISDAHLNNTFTALTKKGILARDKGEYIANPIIIPSKSIIFTFAINGKQG